MPFFRHNLRNFLARIACFALLLQALAPLALTTLDIQTLCTAQGSRSVAINAAGEPVELPGALEHCPLCVLHHPPVAAVLPPVPTITLAQVTLPDAFSGKNTALPSLKITGFDTRAPPAFS